MSFGVICLTGPGMRQVVGLAIGPREGVLLGRIWGAPLYVTNGNFTASVCDSASTVGAAVVRLVGSGIAVLDGVHVVQGCNGNGRFWGFCSPFSQWETPLDRRR